MTPSLKPIAAALLAMLSSAAGAQVQTGTNAQNFASENAILDTAIPFAIGAREARQSLRGAFGWPTFQEGLVQGVYFRFDPDGYARFAPTPRLDSDVFEVICRPRTYSCMGRKGPMSMILNSRGQLQLKLDGVADGDRFYVSEGVSEIQVPERILQPLEQQLENLLSSGGELIMRRGENEINRVSLTGFAPVSAYLRWIAARQDYTVLPRGWPVPNAAGDGSSASMTQAADWTSPMPQPQYFPVQTDQPAAPLENGAEVAEVKGELKVLRELLLARNGTAPEPQPAAMPAPTLPQHSSLSDLEARLNALQSTTERILMDLEHMNHGKPDAAPVSEPMMAAPKTSSHKAQQLDYLMSEIGLDAETALMLLNLKSPAAAPAPTMTPNGAPNSDLVTEILAELEADLTPRPDTAIQYPTMLETPASEPAAKPEEYQLLSDYFRSVFQSE